MPERTIKELDQTYEILAEVDPDMARRFKAMVYPERAVAELEKELAELKQTHAHLYNRWRSSRDELHELRMSMVTLSFERRAAPRNGLSTEFARWHEAWRMDRIDSGQTTYPETETALYIGYTAGRMADALYKENPLSAEVQDVMRYLSLLRKLKRCFKWLA